MLYLNLPGDTKYIYKLKNHFFHPCFLSCNDVDGWDVSSIASQLMNELFRSGVEWRQTGLIEFFWSISSPQKSKVPFRLLSCALSHTMLTFGRRSRRSRQCSRCRRTAPFKDWAALMGSRAEEGGSLGRGRIRGICGF